MAGSTDTIDGEQEHGPPSDPTRALDVQSIGRLGAAVAWLAALGGAGAIDGYGKGRMLVFCD